MTNLSDLNGPETTSDQISWAYSACNDRTIQEALEKLSNFDGFKDRKVIYRIAKIKATYDQKQKIVKKAFSNLIDKHAIMVPVTEMKDGEKVPVLDAKGNPKMQPKIQPTNKGTMDFAWKDEVAFEEEWNSILKTSFTIKAIKIKVDDCLDANLTANELKSIAPIISDIDPEFLTPEEDDEVIDGATTDQGTNPGEL